jgi:hypothetical protein
MFSWGVRVRSGILSATAIGFALTACAGRDPQPIASVQPQDMYADCTMIRAEIEANNAKTKELADEQGWKVAQNVGAGLAGLVIWPIWFGMDWKGAAAKDAAALQARQRWRNSGAPPDTDRLRHRGLMVMCHRRLMRLRHRRLTRLPRRPGNDRAQPLGSDNAQARLAGAKRLQSLRE